MNHTTPRLLQTTELLHVHVIPHHFCAILLACYTQLHYYWHILDNYTLREGKKGKKEQTNNN